MSMRRTVIRLLRSGSLAGLALGCAGVSAATWGTIIGPRAGAWIAAAGAALAAVSKPLQDLVLELLDPEHDGA